LDMIVGNEMKYKQNITQSELLRSLVDYDRNIYVQNSKPTG